MLGTMRYTYCFEIFRNSLEEAKSTYKKSFNTEGRITSSPLKDTYEKTGLLRFTQSGTKQFSPDIHDSPGTLYGSQWSSSTKDVILAYAEEKPAGHEKTPKDMLYQVRYYGSFLAHDCPESGAKIPRHIVTAYLRSRAGRTEKRFSRRRLRH